MTINFDDEGVIYIKPESNAENYALKKWVEENTVSDDKKVDIDLKNFAILDKWSNRLV